MAIMYPIVYLVRDPDIKQTVMEDYVLILSNNSTVRRWSVVRVSPQSRRLYKRDIW